MEITKLKWHSADVYCLFTGEQYIFTNSYYGILAVAERSAENRDLFTVYYGNEYTIGGSLGGDVCAELAERFVSKAENKYFNHMTFFERHKEDLRAWSISCKAEKF